MGFTLHMRDAISSSDDVNSICRKKCFLTNSVLLITLREKFALVKFKRNSVLLDVAKFEDA